MFNKILIANRGEIATRIIRACKELSIKTVAVFSAADKHSLHVKLADEAVCIGPAQPKESYLNIKAIISAAEVTGAEAIHPGYGFLAENEAFSQMCADHNITFIGATPSNISRMGDKNSARDTMKAAGVPIVPGSDGLIESEDELRQVATSIGYPIIIKATAGGGGKGMRVVENESELISAFKMATTEASAAFGNGAVYVEKFVTNPRHIEIQVLSDPTGNAVHLFERDCSIQRRHQKLVEESPSPFISNEVRQAMASAAIKAAQSINYRGAGTIEFIVDDQQNFYFMEMNTRIQVEHPVTECITGTDLIKEQIKIAATNHCSVNQDSLFQNGHAIEFRINAEDPDRDFLPMPGTIELFLPPGGPGIRVDSHCYPGYKVPPNYDSLLAKLIVWAPTRQECIERSKRALSEFIIDGVKTTIPFHLDVLNHTEFINGNVTTKFIDEHFLKPTNV
ncbi:MAG: acetyl-CoA carboxylase biotin carboxylase subunit [Candidatus Margulisiibacteriota bacterium]|nr:acetyl-CoA carboxylase biotin carboxylase subunit [Candidatus Margulisiibacteriota bacterium]